MSCTCQIPNQPTTAIPPLPPHTPLPPHKNTTQEYRRKLPAWCLRERIVSTVRASQVVVISGETGCGKTTQVPQFLLDDALHAGG
jgi:HrpA-like RNA helicase